MNNYFYNMVDTDEMATLEYIPTIPKFLEFIKKQYSDLHTQARQREFRHSAPFRKEL